MFSGSVSINGRREYFLRREKLKPAKKRHTRARPRALQIRACMHQPRGHKPEKESDVIELDLEMQDESGVIS